MQGLKIGINKGGSKINHVPRSFYMLFFQDDFTVALW